MSSEFFHFSKRESVPDKEKFGRDIEAKLTFIRHQDPGKTPEGMSADFLTEKGQLAAQEQGGTIEAPKVAGYASPKLRAQETEDLILQNVNEGTEVINKKLAELEGTRAAQRGDNQRPENRFRIKVRKELDALVNFGNIKPQIDAWVAEQKKAGDERGVYDLMIEYYLDNPEVDKAGDVLTPREAAAEIAERAATELGMTERFYQGSQVEMVNVTHGPKLEPFLQEVIGFKSLVEIGGAVQPGEGLSFMVKIDNQGQKETKLLFRGKEYAVDEEKIKELAQEYRDRLKIEKPT